MAILVPNILGADAFQVQADARDARFTWKREGGKDIPGLIIAAKPSLRFPLPGAVDAAALRSAIDAAASQDDAMAWAFAARWWITYAWERYQEVGPDGAWQQLDWAGARDPDTLLPEQKSLVNGLSLGGLEILVDKPWLTTDTWPHYFTSLIAQIVLKTVTLRVSTLIDIQMAMRSVAWWMSNMVGGDSVQFQQNVGPCAISRAYRANPTISCAMEEEHAAFYRYAETFYDLINDKAKGTRTQAEDVQLSVLYLSFFNKALALVTSGTVSKEDARQEAERALKFLYKMGGTGVNLPNAAKEAGDPVNGPFAHPANDPPGSPGY